MGQRVGVAAALLLANEYNIGSLFGLLAGASLIAWLFFVFNTLRKAGKMAKG